MKIGKSNTYEHAEWLLRFLESIHGNNPYEIRFVPESNGQYPISVLKQGDTFLLDSYNAKKIVQCKANPENFAGLVASELYLYSAGAAICFTVNSPNVDIMDSCFTRDIHIKEGGKINCQFVDIDAPKEVRVNLELLKQWKMVTTEQIMAFDVKPSIIVVTKHGFHVYWLLQDGQIKLFRHIQMQLIQQFDGDEMCVNESRVMRLPNFMHRKDPRNPFPVLVELFEPKRRYTQEYLMSVLPELSEETVKEVSKESASSSPIDISNSRRGKIVDLLKDKLVWVNDRNEKKIVTRCCLPDHPDLKPSAWFDIDYMWYHCCCGAHFSVDELAEEMGWKDVLDALHKYDLDIDAEINKIKAHLLSVNDLSHLELSSSEQSIVERITAKVIFSLSSLKQQANEKHKKYIYDIVQVLYKATKDKPYLVPLDMGGGKSTIVRIFLKEIMEEKKDFGAVVVVERRQDAKALRDYINESAQSKVAYAMYGFDEVECILNANVKKNYESCPARANYRICPHTKICRYWNQGMEQKTYPVMIMTAQRMLQDSSSFNENYSQFHNLDGTETQREWLIVDEKPKTTYVKSYKKKEFLTLTNRILHEFVSGGNLDLHGEFLSAVNKVESLRQWEKKGRTLFDPVDEVYCFSDGFKKVFGKMFDYTRSASEIPLFIESVMRNGGFIESKKDGGATITTSEYYNNRHFKHFKTIVFDGTADIDPEYRHEDYHMFDFEPLRSYEGLTIYQCDLVSGTKTTMKKEGKQIAFCEDVRRIADENPLDKIFLPVFKDNREIVEEKLKDLIDSGRIKVAHFGSTRGSNKFHDCDVVVLGGILHKGEEHYIGKAKPLYECSGAKLEDLNCSKYDVRRFDDSRIETIKILDMLVDYSQELKRSSQRDSTKDVEGKVYIFHNDNTLLQNIGLKFPNCKIDVWNPQSLIINRFKKKSNAKNVQALMNIFLANHPEIPFSLIKEETGMSSQLLRNTLDNVRVIALYTALGYKEYKDGKNKKFVKAQ